MTQQSKGEPKKNPPDGAKAQYPALPQNRNVAPQINVLTPGMRRIMELLGKTHGEISPDERSKINQQLHDLIILEPTFFSINDLPIRRDLLTRDNLRVFQSANKYKERNQREQQRQAPKRSQRKKKASPIRAPSQEAGPKKSHRLPAKARLGPRVKAGPQDPIQKQKKSLQHHQFPWRGSPERIYNNESPSTYTFD